MGATREGRRHIRDYTLLDQFGDPMPRPAMRRAIDPNPRGIQTYSSHPEIGLTIEALLNYHRKAEDGAPVQQFDMWDGLIERHGEVRGMFNERIEDVAGCDFTILPGRDDKPSRLVAGALEDLLRHSVGLSSYNASDAYETSFATWRKHQLTCVRDGISASNLVWDMVDGYIAPVRYAPIAARRFGSPKAEQAHEIWLVDGKANGFVALEPGLWSVSRYEHRNPWASGLMRSCDWWMLFSLQGFKQWQVFANMFGLPLAIGYYEEGAGLQSREALEDAVLSIGQDGYSVLSNLTELVIKETARGGDSSTVYPQIMKTCNAMLAKLITGGTLNTDVAGGGAGSYNAATVHADRSYKMKRSDADRMAESFAASIARAFVHWNGFDGKAAPPRIHAKIDKGGLDRAKELEILGQAVPLSASQIREEHGLREPTGPEDEVKFAKPEPAGTPGKNQDKEKNKP